MTPLGVVVFGHAPPWLAFTLWLVIGVLVTLLRRALHGQADRERAQRDADRSQLDDIAARLDDIERYLFADDPPRGDDP